MGTVASSRCHGSPGPAGLRLELGSGETGQLQKDPALGANSACPGGCKQDSLWPLPAHLTAGGHALRLVTHWCDFGPLTKGRDREFPKNKTKQTKKKKKRKQNAEIILQVSIMFTSLWEPRPSNREHITRLWEETVGYTKNKTSH